MKLARAGTGTVLLDILCQRRHTRGTMKLPLRQDKQQAERIDENVPFLTLDQLAGVKAVRINVGPPFSAPFTL